MTQQSLNSTSAAAARWCRRASPPFEPRRLPRGLYATVLLLADAYENADWPLVDTLSGNMELPSLYAEAVHWANTRLAAVTAR